jgi:hypothetical protein
VICVRRSREAWVSREEEESVDCPNRADSTFSGAFRALRAVRKKQKKKISC